MARTTSRHTLPTLAIVLALLVPVGAAIAAPATFSPGTQGARARDAGASGRIAFTSTRDGVPAIYVMGPDGAGQRVIPWLKHLGAAEADWHPGGGAIAFTGGVGVSYWDIWEASVGSPREWGVPRTQDQAVDRAPAWSPDGRALAWVSWRSGQPDIYVRGRGGETVALTSTPEEESSPTWSPDGARIAFALSGDIYVMNADGSGRTNLTNTPYLGEAGPAWSPDGNSIAYERGWDIYLMRTDGSDQHAITSGRLGNFEPAWSPDSSQIAFTSSRDDNYEIYVMNADGSGQIRLTHNAVSDTQPDWAPASAESERISLTVSLYRNPSTADRGKYESVMRYLADALYEASNGGMRLCQVTVYADGSHATDADIIWQAGGPGSRCWPMSQVGGYGHSGMRIAFCDVNDCVRQNGSSCGNEDYLSDDVGQQNGGYTLAHEMGHYLLGLYGEHAGSASDAPFWQPRLGDTPVPGSIMNQQRQAIAGGGYPGDLAYLNFSTSLNNNADTSAQHRVYGASAWKTLVRPLVLDPGTGGPMAKQDRVGYRMLARHAPAAGQAPSIELPAARSLARACLSVGWVWTPSAGSVNAAAQDQLAVVVNASPAGPFLTESAGQTAALYAMASKGPALIAGASVSGEATDPTGTHFAVTFADDGVSPDGQAGDGIYAATLTPPGGSLLFGTYSVSVTFTSSGADVFTYASYDTNPAPDGSEVTIPDAPVGTDFTVSGSVDLAVQHAVYLPLTR